MAGSFEVGSIIARIGIDESPFVKQGRALLTKARKLGKDLQEAVQSTAGAALGGAAGAARGAAGAAVGAGLGAGAAAAAGAGLAGTTAPVAVVPKELQEGGGREVVRRAEELGRRIREAFRRGLFGGGGIGAGLIGGAVRLLSGGEENALIQRAVQFGSRLREGIRDVDFTVISSERTVTAMERIRRAGRRLAQFLRTELRGAFIAGFRVPVRTVLGAFRIIRGAARLTGLAITKSFGGVGSIFTTLRRTIFNLRAAFAGVIFALGGLALVNRAKEIDSLRTAFENLTGAVGANAESFIVDLRKATRGAVSDLDLFRVTNNAALLGVVQSQDEYVRLATVARRLGRAVGRTTVDAINDLSIGIGRQSRLILDNLGIVVRVEQANEKYANSLGATVSQLTVVDKQQAFVNATLEAAEDKVASLGPDVDNLNDAFGRFTASISNTATVVAEAFVGPGGFNAIAEFLTRQENNIRRFATLVAEIFTAIVTSIGRVLRTLFSAGTSREFTRRIGRIVGEIFQFLSILISTLLRELFGKLGLLTIGLVAGLLGSLGNVIIEKLLSLGASIGEFLGVLFLRIQSGFEGTITLIASKIPGLNKALGLDDPEIAKQAIKNLDREAEAAIEALKSKGKGAQDFIRENARENQKIIDEFAGDIGEAFALETVEAVGRSFETLKSQTKDLGEEGSILGEEFSKGFDDITKAVDKFRDTAGTTGKPLRDLSANARQAERALQAISDQFNQILGPFANRLQTLTVEVKTVGLEDSEKELLKFDAAFEAIKTSLGPRDLARLEETRQKLADLLVQRDAAVAAEETKKKLEELEDQIIEITDTIDQVSVGELAIAFRELGRELDEAISEAPADRAEDLRDKFQSLAVSLANLQVARVAGELERLEASLVDIDATGAELKVRELERDFLRFVDALRASGIEAAIVDDILRRMRQSVNDLQEKEAFADLRATAADLKKSVADARFEFDQLSRTELQQSLAEVNREFDEQIRVARGAADALIELKREQGASNTEVLELDESLQKQIASLEELRVKALQTAAAVQIKTEADKQATIIADSIEKNVGGAIARALARGESLGKQWAQILGGFLNDALENAIKNMTKFLQGSLSKLFENIGGGAGAGALASGLLGIGAAILQNLDSKSQSTVEDFDEAINSSEAVRGVVAGPTNVAISKIGDSLKQAMRTTEILLSEILATLQTGGGVGGGTTLESNAALPLSTSSAS